MESMIVVVFIVCCGWLWRHRDESGKVHIPAWIWKVLGGFVLIILVRNIRSVIVLLTTQADAWWPMVEMYANKFMTSLRSLLEKVGNQ